jgi:hypothetical protein
MIGSSTALDLTANVDPDAGNIRSGLGEIEAAGKIGLDPPRGRELRPRCHYDVAAKIGALVERLDGEIVNLLAEHVTADQVADRAAYSADDLAGSRADLAGDADAAVERRYDRKRVRLSAHRHRAARDRETDLGLAEQLRNRIVVFAGEFARRVGVNRACDGCKRDRDGCDDARRVRHRLQGGRRLHDGDRFRQSTVERGEQAERPRGHEADCHDAGPADSQAKFARAPEEPDRCCRVIDESVEAAAHGSARIG